MTEQTPAVTISHPPAAMLRIVNPAVRFLLRTPDDGREPHWPQDGPSVLNSVERPSDRQHPVRPDERVLEEQLSRRRDGRRAPLWRKDDDWHSSGIASPRFLLEDCADDVAALADELGVERFGYRLHSNIAATASTSSPDCRVHSIRASAHLQARQYRGQRAKHDLTPSARYCGEDTPVRGSIPIRSVGA